MSGPEVVLIEFNELSPALIDRFMAEGRLPNFARFRRESEVYLTDAGEAPPNLEPWIQWVTVHSGMTFGEHGVFHLGDGFKLAQPQVWDVLSEAGHRVWVCGSMNLRHDTPINGWVLPDPWMSRARPFPDALAPYYRFVQAHVQEYTNDRIPLTRADELRFISFMVRHGLSASTVRSIVSQLAAERTGPRRWKRAVILDKLQFDLFCSVRQKLNPTFSTFFLNSTAHFQHLYWRHMEPELFAVKPDAAEQEELGDAIAFGYQQMDDLLGRFLALAGPRTTLVFCTALSQQPCLKYEESGGKVIYRPRDFGSLLSLAGVTAPFRISPVMAEEFHVDFENAETASAAARLLERLTVNGRPAMKVQLGGLGVFGGCGLHDALPRDAVLRSESGQEAAFFDVFYLVEGVKSGMHHPQGMLWIRHPDRRHSVHAGARSLTAIAPTVLDWFSVKPPSHMRGEALSVRGEERVATSP